ncbi:MAG: hypothetical protein K2F77_04210, partial [Muribaculaceae bacterium]|nr:hypothetical protein [Muribaculaceae bacterium]
MGISLKIDRDRDRMESQDIPAPEFPLPDAPVAPEPESAAGVECTVLRTENLVKKYGKRTVVNHVNI